MACVSGFTPKLWAFLNDVLQCVQAIKFSDLQLSFARAELEENGLPFRPNDWFSIIEEVESMTDLLHDIPSVRGAEKSDDFVDTLVPELEPEAVKQSAVRAVASGLVK